MKVLKQRFYHSCLVSALMMICGIDDENIEKEVFFEGEKRDLPWYLNSILSAFENKTHTMLTVFVDNKYFSDELNKSLDNKNISVEFKKITISLIQDLIQTSPIILHLDDNYLGDYSHASHFVVVSKIRKDKKLEILDPSTGSKKYLTCEQLSDSISSLKNHIKMCPIVIQSQI